MTPRITEAERRTFAEYESLPLSVMVSGASLHLIKRDPEAGSAETAFAIFDRTGVMLPTSEPERLARVLSLKASLNLQVKMWAEGVADGLFQQEEMVSILTGFPPWVLHAVYNQASRIAKVGIGFCPRFMRLEFVHDHLWFPYMDPFDPEI